MEALGSLEARAKCNGAKRYSIILLTVGLRVASAKSVSSAPKCRDSVMRLKRNPLF